MSNTIRIETLTKAAIPTHPNRRKLMSNTIRIETMPDVDLPKVDLQSETHVQHNKD